MTVSKQQLSDGGLSHELPPNPLADLDWQIEVSASQEVLEIPSEVLPMMAVTAECSFCGKRLSQDQAVFIGCCPLCQSCYESLRRV